MCLIGPFDVDSVTICTISETYVLCGEPEEVERVETVKPIIPPRRIGRRRAEVGRIDPRTFAAFRRV